MRIFDPICQRLNNMYTHKPRNGSLGNCVKSRGVSGPARRAPPQIAWRLKQVHWRIRRMCSKWIVLQYTHFSSNGPTTLERADYNSTCDIPARFGSSNVMK